MYTAHGFHFYEGAPFINRTLYKKMEKIAAKYTDVLVTINEEDYRAAKEFHLREKGIVKLIPGVGIDINEIESAKKDKSLVKQSLGLDKQSFVCMSVGELNKNKNQLFVLEALKEYFFANSNLHYLICGVGPLQDQINEWIQKNNLDKQIHLLGYRNDVRSIIYGADLFFSSSLREGLPVSVMEAMVAGTPVIVSNVRGNHDLIKNAKNGLLFEIGNTNQLIQRFESIYKNPSYGKELAEQAKEDVLVYRKENIDQMILDLYK